MSVIVNRRDLEFLLYECEQADRRPPASCLIWCSHSMRLARLPNPSTCTGAADWETSLCLVP
jgi:hypothetical protein